ncbi:integrator complex subunit 3 homolog isoform X2 [Armigeres subalbatus]|uniref:integrator complex subunit 3 homolog isoform X2 n=1 Tax=Armigeres subalbatus TaxID=124917 RepID=UPI002ED553E3
MDNIKSKLFIQTIVDVRDDFEEKYEKAFRTYEEAITGVNNKELHELLSGSICKEKQHEEISLALIYLILTDTTAAPKTYSDLTLLTHDGFAFVTNNLAMLVAEKYQRLNDVPRKQMLWFLKELIKNQVLNVDNLVWNILRQASGGDISPKNVALVDGLLDIFIEHRTWLEKDQFLVGTVIYTFLRLLEDHSSPQFNNLHNKEVAFVISLIRERFTDVLPLGREFVRLLQNVSRIPEFEALWKDILHNPKKMCPTFNGVMQLMQTKTSRRFLRCRLTPEVERKLHFLISNVKFGNQKRYQDWFQEKYFTTPESQSLRSDLIRFIIGAIHPTNDMLCSDIIPRWAVIGWLLTSCTNAVAQANAKLSLFYDWLFFDPQKDNIMNIEPGILVMYHSIKNHPLVSCTLLDFLCRIMKHFYPKGEDRVRAGIYNSLRIILEKQVIPNLFPLLESSKLDRELKLSLRENFRDFFSSSVATPAIFSTLSSVKALSVEDDQQSETDRIEDNYNHTENIVNYNTSNEELKFSDDEDENKLNNVKDEVSDDDDLPLSKVLEMEKPIVQSIPEELLSSIDAFANSKNADDFELLMDELIETGLLNNDQETYINERIALILQQSLFGCSIFPESKSEECLSDTISGPIFCLFKMMLQTDEKQKQLMKNLVMHVQKQILSAGYLLLHYLKVNAKLQTRRKENVTSAFKGNVYKYYCTMIDSPFEDQLKKDLEILERTNARLFFWILPDLYKEYKNVMLNNIDLLTLIIGAIDANNLRDIIFNVTQGKLVMFTSDDIIDVIRETLEYETFEQFCFWQLIQAHDIPLESFQDIIPELDTSVHAEALTYILLLLKNEKPSTELVKCLLSRESKTRADAFVISVLRCWCEEYEGKLSEIIAGLLQSKYPASSPNKRKRPLKSSPLQHCTPSSEQILIHLEHFRRSCRHGNGTGTGLYVQNEMQRSLQQAFAHSTDSQKKHFADLFALAAEDETSAAVGRRSTSSRGRKPPASKKESSASNSSSKKNTDTTYGSDDSTDEDWSKQKSGKRRKKAFSDSD